MAMHFEEVSEENNRFIIERLNQSAKNDSEESKFSENILTSYFVRLNRWMEAKETCGILKQLPSVGKLLSTACKNIDRKVSIQEALVDCIISLSNLPESLNSTSKVEQKVGQWAAEQLQMTLSTCFTEDNVDFMNQLGITQSELIQCQIEEISSMIESENIFGKLQADDDNECPTSHCSCLICKIAAVLPPFFNEPELKNLIQSILIATKKSKREFCFYNNQSRHSSLTIFLDGLIKNRSLVKGLSDESQVSLWKYYLPAFELEIMDVFSIAVTNPFLSDESILAMLQDQHQLVLKHCGNDDLLGEAAFIILRVAMKEFGCHPAITSLVHHFYLATQKCQSKKIFLGCKSPMNLFSAFPLSLEGLSSSGKESIIKMLAEELKRLEESHELTRFDAWFALVQKKHFIRHALHLSLHGSVDILDDCLSLLTSFYFQPSKANIQIASPSSTSIKKVFKSFIINIRCLLHKKILQLTDLSYPIELCKRGVSGCNTLFMHHLLRDLVLRFLVDANGSPGILREIFSLITADLSSIIKLDLWLRALEDKVRMRNGQKLSSIKEEDFLEDKVHSFSIFSSCLLERSKFDLSNVDNNDSISNGVKQLNSMIHRVENISKFLVS